jgi:hypothetical protein
VRRVMVPSTKMLPSWPRLPYARERVEGGGRFISALRRERKEIDDTRTEPIHVGRVPSPGAPGSQVTRWCKTGLSSQAARSPAVGFTGWLRTHAIPLTCHQKGRHQGLLVSENERVPLLQ